MKYFRMLWYSRVVNCRIWWTNFVMYDALCWILLLRGLGFPV